MNRVMNACLSAANFGACVVHRGRGVTSRMCMDGGGGGGDLVCLQHIQQDLDMYYMLLSN